MSFYRLESNQKADYLNQTFCLKSPFLDKIKQAVQEEGVERMQISAHEACLLQFLVQCSKAQKIVEIGTLYAYSTYHLAESLKENGKVWTLDQAEARHKKAQSILKSSPLIDKIEWVTSPAKEGLKSIESGAPFDMIFIDADKEAYGDYLKWAELHLKKGGLLVADNTFLWGAVYGENTEVPKETIEIVKSFNQKLSHSSAWQGALIPTVEGMTVAIKS